MTRRNPILKLMRPQRLLCRLLIISPLLLDGCVGTRLAQFKDFSQAGASYIKATDSFFDEAGLAAIRGDTAILLKARADLSEPQRRSQIQKNDTLLRQRLLILRQIKAHNRLLGEYFDVLGQMADSKAPASLRTAAQGIYDSMAGLSPALKSANIGGFSVGDALPGALPIVIAPMKARVLERELKSRALLIERELALQEAALTVVTQELKTDLAVELNTQETTEIIDPYALHTDLPGDWPAKRETLLIAVSASENVGAAADAAKKLRLSFQKLVANELTSQGLSSLISDIYSTFNLPGKDK